jgi:hypothetical protein
VVNYGAILEGYAEALRRGGAESMRVVKLNNVRTFAIFDLKKGFELCLIQ